MLAHMLEFSQIFFKILKHTILLFK